MIDIFFNPKSGSIGNSLGTRIQYLKLFIRAIEIVFKALKARYVDVISIFENYTLTPNVFFFLEKRELDVCRTYLKKKKNT